MRFTNLTRHNEIGANCYHLEAGGAELLLDCGSHPKFEGNEGMPKLEFLKGRKVDAVLVTHGHLDHLGALPLVLADHPGARAYLSQASCLIADRALHNSASVMLKQRGELNLPEYPLFTHGMVDRMAEEFEMVAYGRPFGVRDATVTYYEAGHVLGAAGIWVEAGGGSLFYTGDVKFTDMKITRGAQFPEKRPDTMVIECTRGATPTPPGYSWDTEVDRLASAIHETHEAGGSVLIPCFALGKTQEILKVLHDLMQQGRLRKQAIFISGLGAAYTEIYDELARKHPRVCPGFEIEKHMEVVVLDSRKARSMELGGGRIFLVSSGMMTPRTMSHAMALKMAGNPKHSIFFVGYLDPESPAGKLKQAGQGGRAEMGGGVGEIDIRCKVEKFDFTSHCTREDMMEYVLRVRPPQVVLVHGEKESLEWFQRELGQRMPESKVIIPPSGETLVL